MKTKKKINAQIKELRAQLAKLELERQRSAEYLNLPDHVIACLQEFEEAAMNHGLMQDYGCGPAVDKAEARFNLAKHSLVVLLSHVFPKEPK